MTAEQHKTSWSRIEDFREEPSYYYGRHVAKTIPPSPSTDAQAFGKGFHLAVLEPEKWDEQVAVPPKVDRRTNAGKAAWAEFVMDVADRLITDKDREHFEIMLERCPDVVPDIDKSKKGWEAKWAEFRLKYSSAIILSPSDVQRVEAMAAAVWAHPIASGLLAMDGPTEHAIEWTHKPTGLVVRGRIDKLADNGRLIIDLKSSANQRGKPCGACSPKSFAGVCVNRGYHRQDAIYRMGQRALHGVDARACMIVVASYRPHTVAVYELDDDALNTGANQVEATLHRLKQCLDTGDWTSPYSRQSMTLELPPWAHSEDIWDAWCTADAMERGAA